MNQKTYRPGVFAASVSVGLLLCLALALRQEEMVHFRNQFVAGLPVGPLTRVEFRSERLIDVIVTDRATLRYIANAFRHARAGTGGGIVCDGVFRFRAGQAVRMGLEIAGRRGNFSLSIWGTNSFTGGESAWYQVEFKRPPHDLDVALEPLENRWQRLAPGRTTSKGSAAAGAGWTGKRLDGRAKYNGRWQAGSFGNHP